MIIKVFEVNPEPRMIRGQQNWGVKANYNGRTVWIKLFVGFQPQVGQQFDVSVKESVFNGKTNYFATVLAPAPAQQPAYPGNVPPPPPPQQFKSAVVPLAVSNKILWGDWSMVLGAAWESATKAGMPPAEAVAVVNTTLIAFSNGKLHTPIESGPVSREPGEDDDISF